MTKCYSCYSLEILNDKCISDSICRSVSTFDADLYGRYLLIKLNARKPCDWDSNFVKMVGIRSNIISSTQHYVYLIIHLVKQYISNKDMHRYA